jgi:hypothetical protein
VILRDESADCDRPASELLAAWDAVASVQVPQPPPFLFVTQPDHAHVSGALAAAFDRRRFPWLTAELLEAIALHDEGWALLEGSSPRPLSPALHDGHAVPFNAAPAEQFLRAWTISIARAEQAGALAGLTVSRHFQALGKFGLAKLEDQPEEAARIRRFLDQEAQRESRLRNGGNSATKEASAGEALTQRIALLQFCDLLSLHLCSNAAQPVEFPQDFGCGRIRLRRQHGSVKLSPSPFEAPVTIGFDVFQAGPDCAVAGHHRVEVQIS